jgi:hypothetical protein
LQEDSSSDGGTDRVNAASKSMVSANDAVTIFLKEDTGARGCTGRFNQGSQSVVS